MQEALMLSKCANPVCMARFHYLHEGKIFNIEITTWSAHSEEMSLHRIEHYWLCEACAKVYRVGLANGTVSIHLLHRELPSKVESGRN
jgi:hypothetical protein